MDSGSGLRWRALWPRGPRCCSWTSRSARLDARVRDELRTWLRRLHDEVHVTSLFVTHDQQEAFEVADQVIVLNHGRVEQMGPPQDLYDRPATPFVTEFLGSVNVLKGPSALIESLLDGGHPAAAGADGDSSMISFYVRPHDLEATHESNGRPSWPGRLLRVTRLGAIVRLDVALDDGTDVRIELGRDRYAALEPKLGEPLYVTPRDFTLFADQQSPA